MRNDHGLPGATESGPLRHLHQQMTVTERGLRLGAGTLLAKMGDDGLRLEGEEERILTLLAIAYRGDVPDAMLGSLRRATKHWRSADKSLAAIHLAQSGLGKLDAAGAYRLSLAAKLIEAGVAPREIARELGLNPVQFDVNMLMIDLAKVRSVWSQVDKVGSIHITYAYKLVVVLRARRAEGGNESPSLVRMDRFRGESAFSPLCRLRRRRLSSDRLMAFGGGRRRASVRRISPPTNAPVRFV